MLEAAGRWNVKKSNPLIPFSSIDPDDSQWSEDQVEAAEFLSHMDNEGGLTGLLYYGVNAFPEELQGLAERTSLAIDYLRKAVDDWAAERGVVY